MFLIIRYQVQNCYFLTSASRHLWRNPVPVLKGLNEHP